MSVGAHSNEQLNSVARGKGLCTNLNTSIQGFKGWKVLMMMVYTTCFWNVLEAKVSHFPD